MREGTQGAARRASKRASAARAKAKRAIPADDGRTPLPVVDVAARLGVSRWTIYRAIDAGELRAVKVGQTMKVRPVDLDAYLVRAS